MVLPEGDGKEIAEKSCHACHELTNLTHASKSLDDWRDTVHIMIDNGADVPADKVDVLVNYLAKNFGPKTASSTPDAHSSGKRCNHPSREFYRTGMGKKSRRIPARRATH